MTASAWAAAGSPKRPRGPSRSGPAPDGPPPSRPDEPGEPRRAAGRARLRDHAAPRRQAVHAALERAAHAGDGERTDEGVADFRVRDAGAEQRDERRRREPVERREPRAIGETHARERDAVGLERLAHDARAGPCGAAGAEPGAELLQEQLRREVVAHSSDAADERCERLREVLREGERVGRRAAHAGRLRDADARPLERLPEERGGRERRRARHAAAVHGALGDERRERRALDGGVRRLPARARADTVVPRLVGEHGAGHEADPPGAHLPREVVEVGDRERRVAEPLQDERAAPGRPLEAPDAAHLGAQAVGRPEPAQRRVDDGHLRRRGGEERQRRVAGEDDLAGAQVDRERGAAARVEGRRRERCLEPPDELRGRVAARGGIRRQGRDQRER
jgi:hypothetical protein